jgi:8-oxo-dGTP pyrophosphatase MutT (NUDIX family)
LLTAEPPEAAVLVLVWGSPPRVLVERKACSTGGYWSCDVALPGGHVEEGETPEEAALREAWEEAWVYPRAVRIIGRLPPTMTKLRRISVVPVLAEPKGPLCPMPRSAEVDQVFWLKLDTVREALRIEIDHPVRGIKVKGYRVPGGGVLWGATLRILSGVCKILEC